MVAGGLATVASAQSPIAGDAGLQPGDVVQITVWQRDELSGDFIVEQHCRLNALCDLVRSRGSLDA